MTKQKSSLFNTIICWWGKQILRFPWTLLLLSVLLCGFTLHYTMNTLGVDTNTADMLSPDLPFQQNRIRIENAFPQDANAILFVVDAETPEETTQAAIKLAAELRKHSDSFEYVYIPTENDFFRQQALLYLDQDELDKLASKLTDAQPFIGYLAQNYHLEGLLDIVGQALNRQDDKLPTDLNPMLLAIDGALQSQLKGKSQHLSWQNLLAENKLNTEANRTIVIAKPKVDFSSLLPAEKSLAEARIIARQVMTDNPSVRVRITGERALEHEELESVSKGAALSGLASLILVCLSLWIGLHSFKLLISTFIALIMGLILTAGFAALAVGHLNIISIAFAVLYIGLGVDYAIHICLRYRECIVLKMSNSAAIMDSMKNIGLSLLLCTLTTSIGFLAFIPTDYAGVSELGIISGAGMFIGFAISVTILPALLSIMPVHDAKPIRTSAMPAFITNFPFRYAKSIGIISILLVIGSCFVLTKLTFDSNPINLRDPKSESVSTIKELLKSKTESPFALAALADGLENAKTLASRFEQLPSVHETITLASFVAKDQDEKLETIEELSLILGGQLKNFSHTLDNTHQRAALIKFDKDLSKAIADPVPSAPRQTLQQLQQSVQAFVTQTDKSHDPAAGYAKLQENVLGLLPFTMERLKTSLTAEPFGLEDLPSYISLHWVSSNGLYKVLITPEKDQNKIENLKQFASEVQSVDDTVSGLPVADLASGEAVVEAFIEAFSGAFIAIVLLLLVMLKSVRETLLVIAPLLLATILTGATNVILDNPFNFANIIALPLLMGMGVDSGIHIVHRLHSGLSDHDNVLQTSTARGVIFSSVTTLCSFSSLAFTSHLGTASMGLLLAIGISFTLLCSLIVLPAFSTLWGVRGRRI